MNTSDAREKMLTRIRKALHEPVPLPFPDAAANPQPLFAPPADELAVLFAESFHKLQGRFVYCENESDLHEQLAQLIKVREWTKLFCEDARWNTHYSNTISLPSCDVSITGCECLVARTGSVVLGTAAAGGRTTSVYAPVHICIAYSNQLVFDIQDALKLLQQRYGSQLPSFISFATGPSRTADIEKTLVTGVHGPREVFVFLVES